MIAIVHWLEEHMLSCPSKKYLGIGCPGCGMQRSFVELLKGNFIESFKLYPALIPVFITLGILALHLVFRYRKGGIYVMWSFIFSAAVIVISYIVKVTWYKEYL